MHHPTGYFETKEAARKLLEEAGIDPQVVTWNEPRQAADWQAVARELIVRPDE